MARWAHAVLNRAIRLGYRVAYLMLRAWWSIRRPHTHGAGVALWCEGKVLLIHTSYRNCYSLPGGFVRRGEPSELAARRELSEELGIDLPAVPMRRTWHGTLRFEWRDDTMDIWETTMDRPPAVHVAGREIVWAGWMAPSTALGRRLLPHVAEYLTQRQESGDRQS